MCIHLDMDREERLQRGKNLITNLEMILHRSVFLAWRNNALWEISDPVAVSNRRLVFDSC